MREFIKLIIILDYCLSSLAMVEGTTEKLIGLPGSSPGILVTRQLRGFFSYCCLPVAKEQ